MLEDRRIGVVIPAYNEEKLIGRVIETMPDYVDRIYVIDDCSNDETNAKVHNKAITFQKGHHQWGILKYQ